MPEPAVNKNSRSFHIGQNAGLIISSAAAFSFAIAVSGWIILFSDIADIKTALAYIRIERTTQIDDLKKTVQNLEPKVQNLVIQLAALEALTKSNIERLDRRRLQIDKLEDDELKHEIEQLKLEQEVEQPNRKSIQKERMLQRSK